jgi:hypothetical protein
MRLVKFAVLILALSFVSGCATMRLEIEDMIKDGKDGEAAREGLIFLQSPDADERPADEIAWLRRAVGEAALREAMREDTLEGYGRYRRDIPDWPEVKDLKGRVEEREARVVFTEIHRTGDDEARHRRFRQEYSGSSFIYRSKQLEAGSAYSRARGARSIEALRAFRTKYCSWKEAKGVCEQAEIAEGHMALELAIESGNTREIARVKNQYKSIEGLALNAKDAEGQLAFENAQKVGTPQAMERFAKEYPDHVLAQDALMLALEARLKKAKAHGSLSVLKQFEEKYGARLPQKVQRMLRQSQADIAWKEWIEPDPENKAALERYVHAFRDLAGIHAGVTRAREGLAVLALEDARKVNTEAAFNAFIAEHKDWRAAVDLVKAAREGIATLNYVQARRAGTWDAWARFVRRFESWPEAKSLVTQARRRAERLGKPLPSGGAPAAPAASPIPRAPQAAATKPQAAPIAAAAPVAAPPRTTQAKAPPQGPKVTAWREDSATLGSLVQGLLVNVPRDGDAPKVVAKKEKKLERSLRALNRRWYGRKLKVTAARVTDKRPRLALTKSGKVTLKSKLKELRSNGWGKLVGRTGDVGLLATYLYGDSLTACTDCLAETGEVEVALEIPIPSADGGYDAIESGILLDVTKLEAADKAALAGDTLAVRVTHVLKTPGAAGRLNEGTIHPISGHVQGIWLAPGELRIELR